MKCWYVYWEDKTSDKLFYPYRDRMKVFLDRNTCIDYLDKIMKELDIDNMGLFGVPDQVGIRSVIQSDKLLECTCLEVSE